MNAAVKSGDLICPSCGAPAATGWCEGCGIDWDDGGRDELLVAVPLTVAWRAVRKAQSVYRRTHDLPEPPFARPISEIVKPFECWAEIEHLEAVLLGEDK